MNSGEPQCQCDPGGTRVAICITTAIHAAAESPSTTMTTPTPHDDLQPELTAAEAELIGHLDEACALEPAEPGDADTGELLRLELVLDAARAAAERAVELRRERRTRSGDVETSGVREVRDATGRDWRVWSVVPSQSEQRGSIKRVGAEYQGGWLAFESFDGTERRRLPDHPADWQTHSDAELAGLLERAVPVAPRRRRDAGPLEGAERTPDVS